jgi:putative exporter of polyketide antibiotics
MSSYTSWVFLRVALAFVLYHIIYTLTESYREESDRSLFQGLPWASTVLSCIKSKMALALRLDRHAVPSVGLAFKRMQDCNDVTNKRVNMNVQLEGRPHFAF